MYIILRIFKKRELSENMYSAKISTFTVHKMDRRGKCENPSALVTIVMCLFNLRISLSLLIGIMMGKVQPFV